MSNSSGLGSSIASSSELQNGHGQVWQMNNQTNAATPLAPSAPSSFGSQMNGTVTGPKSLPNVGLRYRPDSIRPPPPERRNSTITGSCGGFRPQDDFFSRNTKRAIDCRPSPPSDRFVSRWFHPRSSESIALCFLLPSTTTESLYSCHNRTENLWI